MPADMHKKPFDDGTLIKLEILRQYLRKWLPVFIKDQKHIWSNIGIYDLFAGSGTDSEGTLGSPLIILDELKIYCSEINARCMKVFVAFNERIKDKAAQLIENCKQHLQECKDASGVEYICPNISDLPANCCFTIKYLEKDFKDLFPVFFRKI